VRFFAQEEAEICAAPIFLPPTLGPGNAKTQAQSKKILGGQIRGLTGPGKSDIEN
jgi:hypothetical protein